MYDKHFALVRNPFESAPAVDELYPAQQQQEAQARLQHLVQMRGIGLLSGEPGCGKSTVCRQLLDGLHRGLYRPRYVSLTTGSVLDLYGVICKAFGLALPRLRSQAFLSLREDISRQLEESRQTSVLVIDEAHYLRAELLEEMRLLTNYRMDSENRLCLVLSGHTELRDRLAMTAYQSLSQRIAVRCHLGALDRDEVGGYLEHRLRLVGADVPIFEDPAIEAISLASGGVMRRIDWLAHNALWSAAQAGRLMVNAEDVEKASQEYPS